MTGILILDKPQGFTSFDLVAKVRRLCSEKKCGHSGTLDPMATGVMTVLLGGATKFCDLLPDHGKAYSAVFRPGTVTDTLDITGRIISEKEVHITKEDIENILGCFRGEITQIPPMYSAVSVNGRRLYDLARQGIEVERPERRVTVSRLEITESFDNKEFGLYVECSSGTYIRTLISDIGEKLGCGAVMTSLRRVKANGFTIERSMPLEKLEKMSIDDISPLLIPVDRACEAYPAVTVSGAQAVRFSNGGSLSKERLNNCKVNGLYRVYSPDGAFLGIGEVTDAPDMAVKKVFIAK